jgi:hypothetical protein
MANESTIFAAVKINPVVGQGDIAVDTTGGTLTSSNVVELKYLVASFTKAEGKERLLNAVRAIVAKIERTAWPAA